MSAIADPMQTRPVEQPSANRPNPGEDMPADQPHLPTDPGSRDADGYVRVTATLAPDVYEALMDLAEEERVPPVDVLGEAIALKQIAQKSRNVIVEDDYGTRRRLELGALPGNRQGRLRWRRRRLRR